MTTVGRGAILAWLVAYADALAANKDTLTQLDSAIGDADHGINMDRGFQAVAARLGAPGDAAGPSGGTGGAGIPATDIGGTFKTVAMTLISTVGGASGPLYGTLFLQMASVTAGKDDLSLQEWTAALEAGLEGVMRRGKAVPGDKTMVDCLAPAVEALKAAVEHGAGWHEALARAEQAGRAGMEATVPLVARKGRASYLGERSAGHQDPGATSSHLLLLSALETLGRERSSSVQDFA